MFEKKRREFGAFGEFFANKAAKNLEITNPFLFLYLTKNRNTARKM
jgi:hypothetical protein